MIMKEQCKKCLLQEAGENNSYNQLMEYIASIDESLKVDESVYNKRLSACRKCDMLISGMCLKCGCYVELRAVLKDSKCANADNVIW